MSTGLLVFLIGLAAAVLASAISISRTEFGAAHAGTPTAEVQALFTQLGGTPVISVATAAIASWGWWRYGNLPVALFMIVVVLGQAALTTGLKWIVAGIAPIWRNSPPGPAARPASGF